MRSGRTASDSITQPVSRGGAMCHPPATHVSRVAVLVSPPPSPVLPPPPMWATELPPHLAHTPPLPGRPRQRARPQAKSVHSFLTSMSTVIADAEEPQEPHLTGGFASRVATTTSSGTSGHTLTSFEAEYDGKRAGEAKHEVSAPPHDDVSAAMSGSPCQHANHVPSDSCEEGKVTTPTVPKARKWIEGTMWEGTGDGPAEAVRYRSRRSSRHDSVTTASSCDNDSSLAGSMMATPSSLQAMRERQAQLHGFASPVMRLLQSELLMSSPLLHPIKNGVGRLHAELGSSGDATAVEVEASRHGIEPDA